MTDFIAMAMPTKFLSAPPGTFPLLLPPDMKRSDLEERTSSGLTMISQCFHNGPINFVGREPGLRRHIQNKSGEALTGNLVHHLE